MKADVELGEVEAEELHLTLERCQPSVRDAVAAVRLQASRSRMSSSSSSESRSLIAEPHHMNEAFAYGSALVQPPSSVPYSAHSARRARSIPRARRDGDERPAGGQRTASCEHRPGSARTQTDERGSAQGRWCRRRPTGCRRDRPDPAAEREGARAPGKLRDSRPAAARPRRRGSPRRTTAVPDLVDDSRALPAHLVGLPENR